MRNWRLTHGNTQQADRDLNAPEHVEGTHDATIDDPVVGAPGKTEAEEVLEHEEASKRFDGEVA